MTPLRWLVVFLTWWACGALAQPDAPLRRIEVTDTNNFRLDQAAKTMALPDTLDAAEYVRLREYLAPRVRLGEEELDAIQQLADWVSRRWQHDAHGVAPLQFSAVDILQAAERGQRYSCTEYSKVLRDSLVALGFIARVVTLQSTDIEYGPPGTAHVLVEVWSNQLQKWIMVDPQWGLYPRDGTRWLDVLELYRLKKAGKLGRVAMVPVASVQRRPSEAQLRALGEEYRAFVSGYLGYLSVPLRADRERIHLLFPLDGQRWPLTFHGLPRSAQVFTTDPSDIHFEPNRVSLVLTYRAHAQPVGVLGELEIESEQDYIAKLPKFAAVPDFDISMHHNMPWFAAYELAIDDAPWSRLGGESAHWQLHEGINLLRVRAVNAAGWRGPETFIEIRYGR